MANQKTTELRTLTSTQVANGDWIPIVDVSELTSPTGETKKISAADFSEYVVSGGFANFVVPQHGYQTSNGLSFAANYAPLDELNMFCYGAAKNLGTDFSLSVKAFVPSDALLTDTGSRVLFGVGSQVIGMAENGSRVYVGVKSSSLMGYISDGVTEKVVEYPDYLKLFPDRAFEATITKNYLGTFNFYINSALIGTLSGAPSYISSSYTTMGNGQSGSHWNINCVVYEAHVFNAALNGTKVKQNYYGGVRNNDATLVSSYRPENLNPGPTQWLDSVGDNHLLLPRDGAEATSPTKEFGLIFFSDGTSGYLGNGTQRDVLPENYVLTDCFVYSPGQPLLSVGSTADEAIEGDSGIYSFRNNRVPLVSASYGRNVLPLLELGVAHTDRSLYVFYSASAAPCTFSFQGYTSKYGVINYIPPSPTPTPTPTVTITPSPIPPTPTPTQTGTPTPTPPLPPGIYLSANSFRENDTPTVFTTNVTMSVATASTFSPPSFPGSDIYLSSTTYSIDNPPYIYTGNNTTLSSFRYRLRCKISGNTGTELAAAYGSNSQQRTVAFNNNYSEIFPPAVGTWPAELYWVTYNSSYTLTVQPAPWSVITMSIATASGFTPVSPPAYKPSGHPNVYLSTTTGSSTTFAYDNPPYIYTTDPSVLTPFGTGSYRLRCKALQWDGSAWQALPGGTEHRAIGWNNQYAKIFPPAPGVYRFELYWIKYPTGVFASSGTVYPGTFYAIDVTITP